MKVSVQSESGQVLCLHVAGRVSQRDVDPVNEPLHDVLGDEGYARNLVVDLSEVEALDSSGVNWLLTTQRKLREAGGQLVLHSLSPIARNVIRVLNLHSVLQLADSQTEAMQRIQGEAT